MLRFRVCFGALLEGNRGEQRAPENATHPKTQIFGAVTFLRFRVCCVFGCFLAPSDTDLASTLVSEPQVVPLLAFCFTGPWTLLGSAARSFPTTRTKTRRTAHVFTAQRGKRRSFENKKHPDPFWHFFALFRVFSTVFVVFRSFSHFFKGIAKGEVQKTTRKGGASVCLRLSTFARVCLRLLAFSPLRFVSICLRLLVFARICLRPLYCAPLCVTLIFGPSFSDCFWPSVFVLFRSIRLLPFSGCHLDSPENKSRVRELRVPACLQCEMQSPIFYRF